MHRYRFFLARAMMVSLNVSAEGASTTASLIAFDGAMTVGYRTSRAPALRHISGRTSEARVTGSLRGVG